MISLIKLNSKKHSCPKTGVYLQYCFLVGLNTYSMVLILMMVSLSADMKSNIPDNKL